MKTLSFLFKLPNIIEFTRFVFDGSNFVLLLRHSLVQFQLSICQGPLKLSKLIRRGWTKKMQHKM